jgi:hypothetical protein
LKVLKKCDTIKKKQKKKEKSMADEWNNYGNEEERGEQDYAFQTLNRRGRPKTLGWSVTSLVMGIVSLFTCSFGWASIIFGVVAIIFAIASRVILGYFDGKSIFGLILGIFGAVFGVAMIVFIYALGDEYQKYLWDILKEAYGSGSSGGTVSDF